jgi:hypothetical protein
MIEYVFKPAEGETFNFKVDTSRAARTSTGQATTGWTALDFHKCTNCPLNSKEHPHCPAAVDVEEIVARFKSDLSYGKVMVEVRTASRTYSQLTDMQTALRSLMGLVMATSGCPILARFRGLAKLHLPFASLEETLFRTTGAYMLRQYFVLKEGGTPDFELRGLERLYEDLQTVNRCFKRRVDSASDRDANMNAIGSLIYVAMGVSFSLEDQLVEIRQFAIE